MSLRPLLVLAALLGFCSPVLTHANDCNYTFTDISSALGANLSFLKPEGALAMQHLGSYCCDEGLLDAKTPICQNKLQEGDYPASSRLYDHIVDILRRKLDADNAYSTITPDTNGSQRRTTITNIAQGSTGYNAQALFDLFNNTRKINNTKNYPQQSCDGLDKAKWDGLDLGEKYFNVCQVASCTVKRLYEQNPQYSQSIGDVDNSDAIYNSCIQRAQKIRLNEQSYVQSIMLQKVNLSLQGSLSAFIDSYYSQEGLIRIMETM